MAHDPRVKRYSPKRLRERPVKILTCQGVVTVAVEKSDGRLQVVITPITNQNEKGEA